MPTIVEATGFRGPAAEQPERALRRATMAISERFVEHEDGRRGIIIGDADQWHHRVVVCDTGEEEDWHFQLLTWLFLVPDRIQSNSSPHTP
jgi:hypothetical protein